MKTTLLKMQTQTQSKNNSCVTAIGEKNEKKAFYQKSFDSKRALARSLLLDAHRYYLRLVYGFRNVKRQRYQIRFS
jgi:hypothetical protein